MHSAYHSVHRRLENYELLLSKWQAYLLSRIAYLDFDRCEDIKERKTKKSIRKEETIEASDIFLYGNVERVSLKQW